MYFHVRGPPGPNQITIGISCIIRLPPSGNEIQLRLKTAETGRREMVLHSMRGKKERTLLWKAFFCFCTDLIYDISLRLSLSVSQSHINTYQFDIRLSVQRCLTDPLLSPDTASDCNWKTETHTEKALIIGTWLHGCNTQHIIQDWTVVLL